MAGGTLFQRSRVLDGRETNAFFFGTDRQRSEQYHGQK
jgi:hypothetical protein